MPELTQTRLKEFLQYDPATGIFIWLQRSLESFASLHHGKTWNTRFAGKSAGSVNKITGYLHIRVGGKVYPAHRLAFMHMNGSFPRYQTDHINHSRTDNRWRNLREASNQENGMNQSMPNTNTSGFVGVYWNKRRGKWYSQIRVYGKLIHLGYFTDKDDAIKARKEADIKYGYHENHGKVVCDGYQS